MFRLGRMRPAHARSSVSETLLRIRSLAGYIIGTLESRFRKRQPNMLTGSMSASRSISRALPRMSAWPAIDSIYDMRRPCHVGGGLAVTDL